MKKNLFTNLTTNINDLYIRLLNIDMNCCSMGSVYKTYNAPTNFKFNAFKNHIQ